MKHMKYKAGDRVKIRTWESMKREYGIYGVEDIKCDNRFTSSMEEELNRKYSDRILAIEKIEGDRDDKYYRMKDISNCIWSDDMIEGLYVESVPIYSRFEILDI